MKRSLLLFNYLLTFVFIAPAQTVTQQGVVKTKGRMVNGKYVKGQGLSGATISIQGRSAVLSQVNGLFSFPVPEKTFLVNSVQKKGYLLVDADATKKTYQHSANPLYLVMETPEQQMEDQLEAEEKISKTLREQLKKSRAEIQRLKDDQKITEEEYRQRIVQLMQDQQNNQKLIADMAKEYSQMDYDQMDELNRQISDAILNGELTKADSLLRSKGDMRSRNAEITRRQQAEVRRSNEIKQEQEVLAKSQAGTRKLIEDFAEDCYKYYNMFKLENKHDSAAYYIELRANRDTMNADWQVDAALYCESQNQFLKAHKYYEKALNILKHFTATNPEEYEPKIAGIQNNLAHLYIRTQHYTDAEKLLLSSLIIRQRFAESSPEIYVSDVAQTQNSLAILYTYTQRFDEAEKMYLQSLENRKHLATLDPDTYDPIVANVQNNLANLYYGTRQYEKAEKLYLLVKDTYNRLASSNPKTYEPDVAKIQNNLANLYSDTQQFEEAERMHLSTLDIRKRLAAVNPQAYAPSVADTHYNLGKLYYNNKQYAEAEKMYLSALETYRDLSSSDPDAYKLDIAYTLYNIGALKMKVNYTEAFPFFEEALTLYRELAKTDSAQRQWYIWSLICLNKLYSAVNNYTAAYKTNQELITLKREDYNADPEGVRSDLASILSDQSLYATLLQRFSEGERFAREGLNVDSTQHAINTKFALSLLLQGKYAEAEAIYRQYKDELKDSFLDDFKQFNEAGVIPKECEADVEKIKRLLNE